MLLPLVVFHPVGFGPFLASLGFEKAGQVALNAQAICSADRLPDLWTVMAAGEGRCSRHPSKHEG